ncbi:MAG: ATP-binding protein [Polyangiaceae bacterium]
MVDGTVNPYRSDAEADDLFIGREKELSEIVSTVVDGRNAMHAVMGGRGMGKSSFARQLKKRLGARARTVLTLGYLDRVKQDLAGELGLATDGRALFEGLVRSPASEPSGRVTLVIDEIERLIDDQEGRAFLDNLREAYEKANGSLGVIVLGGTRVRDLLVSDWSPFLRIAGPIHVLSGLGREEAARLIRDPLRLQISDDTVDALWAETAGHPWLLQIFMERAVKLAADLTHVGAVLANAIQESRKRLDSNVFPLWWSNLQSRGQEVYRRAIRRPSSVPRSQWASYFGDDPRPWLEVLASTGLAFLDEDAVLPRGMLFKRWVEENHPVLHAQQASQQDALEAWLVSVGVDPFEHLVVRALAAWARGIVEFPAGAVRAGANPGSGNGGLAPEAFFQMHSLIALNQHERALTAEPEALSMRPQGRSDIKVRSRPDVTRRACIEFKIFGRKDTHVVAQVIGYSTSTDTFAAVVSVDRAKRPLRPEYEKRCFEGAPVFASQDAPSPVMEHPAFYTLHAREGRPPLRVWHFLVQISSD